MLHILVHLISEISHSPPLFIVIHDVHVFAIWLIILFSLILFLVEAAAFMIRPVCHFLPAYKQIQKQMFSINE